MLLHILLKEPTLLLSVLKGHLAPSAHLGTNPTEEHAVTLGCSLGMTRAAFGGCCRIYGSASYVAMWVVEDTAKAMLLTTGKVLATAMHLRHSPSECGTIPLMAMCTVSSSQRQTANLSKFRLLDTSQNLDPSMPYRFLGPSCSQVLHLD